MRTTIRNPCPRQREQGTIAESRLGWRSVLWQRWNGSWAKLAYVYFTTWPQFEFMAQRCVVVLVCLLSSYSRGLSVKSPVCAAVSQLSKDVQSEKKPSESTAGVCLFLRQTQTHVGLCEPPVIIATVRVIVLIIKRYLSRSLCFTPAARLKNAWYFSDKTRLLIHRKQWNLGVFLWKMFKTGGL